MKTVVLNGARREDRSQARVRRLLVEEVTSCGHAIDVRDLEKMRIAPCRGCFGCWTRTPGVCVIDDAGREIAAAAIRSKLLVLLTPVSFGGYGAQLKVAVDRLIGLLSPYFRKTGGEVHHRARYPRYPPLLGVGLLAEPDEEQERLFHSLVERNAVNFHSPFHSAAVVASGREEGLRPLLRVMLGKCRRA